MAIKEKIIYWQQNGSQNLQNDFVESIDKIEYFFEQVEAKDSLVTKWKI